MAITNRIALEVHKGCGGWVSIAPTLSTVPATEYDDTVVLRIDPRIDLAAYEAEGRCRCKHVVPAPDDEWMRWNDQSFAEGVKVWPNVDAESHPPRKLLDMKVRA